MKRYLIAAILLGVSLLGACQTKNETNSNSSKTMDDKNSPFPVHKTDAEWKEQLTPEQYYVIREKGTERPHTGKYNLNFEKGVYTCAACGQELFTSDSKFDAHCGWPSFDSEIGKGRIKYITDKTLGMTRTEIVCARCGGHLGHVFDDGPTTTGQRYCVNSLSIDFKEAGK